MSSRVYSSTSLPQSEMLSLVRTKIICQRVILLVSLSVLSGCVSQRMALRPAVIYLCPVGGGSFVCVFERGAVGDDLTLTPGCSISLLSVNTGSYVPSTSHTQQHTRGTYQNADK